MSAGRVILRALKKRVAASKNAYPVREKYYRLSRPTVTLTNVTLRVVGTFVPPEEFPADATNVIGYSTVIGAKPVARITREQGLLGSPARVHKWQVNIKNMGSFTLFNNGIMHVTANAGVSYEKILTYARRNYIPNLVVYSHNVTKVNGIMYVDRNIKIDQLPGADYTAELFSGATLRIAPLVFILFTNGTILISAKTASDIRLAPGILKKYLNGISDITQIFKYTRSNAALIRRRENINWGKAVPEPPSRILKRMQLLNVRYPPASSYTNKMNGKYVRPGPNGQPRFYPLNVNLTGVRPKVVRAYANAGVAIPTAVRNALGINEGESPPIKKTSNAERRAPNWNTVRSGFYIRPGRGGQPYYKKVPGDIKAAKQGVLNAYKKIGRNIPQHVKNIFGVQNIGTSTPRRPVVTNNRINGRQYSRYTKAELLRIARNAGIPTVSEKMTLADIFQKIKNKVGTQSPSSNGGNVNFTIEGVNYTLLNNGRVRRGRYARKFSTLTLDERRKIISAALNANNAANVLGRPSKNWYSLIINKREQALAREFASVYN